MRRQMHHPVDRLVDRQRPLILESPVYPAFAERTTDEMPGAVDSAVIGGVERRPIVVDVETGIAAHLAGQRWTGRAILETARRNSGHGAEGYAWRPVACRRFGGELLSIGAGDQSEDGESSGETTPGRVHWRTSLGGALRRWLMLLEAGESRDAHAKSGRLRPFREP